MRPDKDQVRISHMREAATRAVTFSVGRSREDLERDDMLVLALTKLVEIVGEAAKHVEVETRSRFPGVPWSDAVRTRDRLTHHYFDIDLDVLWADSDSGPPGSAARSGRPLRHGWRQLMPPDG